MSPSNFWYVNETFVRSLNVYRNQDLLISYYLSVINDPSEYEVSFKYKSFIVRVDNATAATIWAKGLNYRNKDDFYTIL